MIKSKVNSPQAYIIIYDFELFEPFYFHDLKDFYIIWLSDLDNERTR